MSSIVAYSGTFIQTSTLFSEGARGSDVDRFLLVQLSVTISMVNGLFFTLSDTGEKVLTSIISVYFVASQPRLYTQGNL